jgi:hypothetical protein
MTEDQIERAVQSKFDRLDARFMSDSNTMTQATYDAAARAIHEWAENEYRFVVR